MKAYCGMKTGVNSFFAFFIPHHAKKKEKKYLKLFIYVYITSDHYNHTTATTTTTTITTTTTTTTTATTTSQQYTPRLKRLHKRLFLKSSKFYDTGIDRLTFRLEICRKLSYSCFCKASLSLSRSFSSCCLASRPPLVSSCSLRRSSVLASSS